MKVLLLVVLLSCTLACTFAQNVCTHHDGENAWVFLAEKINDAECDVIEFELELISREHIAHTLEIHRTVEIRAESHVDVHADGTNFPFFIVSSDGALSNFHFSQFAIPGSGGAIEVINGASISLISCSFESNTAEVSGGSLYVIDSPSVTLENVDCSNSNADKGSSVYAENSDVQIHTGRFMFNNLILDASNATIYVDGGSLNITEASFQENRGNVAGGISVTNVKLIALNDLQITGVLGDEVGFLYVGSSERGMFHKLNGLGSLVTGHSCPILIRSNGSFAFTSSVGEYDYCVVVDDYCEEDDEGCPVNDPSIIVYHRDSSATYDNPGIPRYALIDDYDDADRMYCEYCQNLGICQPGFVDCEEILQEQYSDCDDLTIKTNVPELVERSLVCPDENVVDGHYYYISAVEAEEQLQYALNHIHEGENFICFTESMYIHLYVHNGEQFIFPENAAVNFYGGEGEGVTLDAGRGHNWFSSSGTTLRFFNIHIRECGTGGCFSLNYPEEFIFYRSSVSDCTATTSAPIFLYRSQKYVEVRESIFRRIRLNDGFDAALRIYDFAGSDGNYMQIVDTVFQDCHKANGAGAALVITEGTGSPDHVILRNLTFDSCTAANGGALYLQVNQQIPLRLENSTFFRCSVYENGHGAAVYVDGHGNIQLFDCIFIANQYSATTVLHDTGVIHINLYSSDESSYVSIVRCQFWFNYYSWRDFVTIYGDTIQDSPNVGIFGNVGRVVTYPHGVSTFLETKSCEDYCAKIAEMEAPFYERRIDCVAAFSTSAMIVSSLSASSASAIFASSSASILESSSSAAGVSAVSAAVFASSSASILESSSVAIFASSSASILESSSVAVFASSSASILESSSVAIFASSSASVIESSSSAIAVFVSSSASILESSSSAAAVFASSTASIAESSSSAIAISVSSADALSSLFELPEASASIMSAWSVSSAAAYDGQNSNKSESGASTAVIGGAVGGALLVLILIAVIVSLIRHNKNLRKEVDQSRTSEQGTNLELSSRSDYARQSSFAPTADPPEPTYDSINPAPAPAPPSFSPNNVYENLNNNVDSSNEVKYANLDLFKGNEALLNHK